MKGCNNYIKDFYYQLWFNSAEFNEFSIDPHHTLVAEAIDNHQKSMLNTFGLSLLLS
ncbi:hypothetical protein DSO57_1023868 [Entomophthora muscae]|uniref:Uncharacterized protein n=1 Tax=Entomophthora muscae TaxID=34485 RepID=A0ACC2RTV9_9FUNG|nr:hypothetical protein DSO57_1023868 [Entomophthora muscae]